MEGQRQDTGHSEATTTGEPTVRLERFNSGTYTNTETEKRETW